MDDKGVVLGWFVLWDRTPPGSKPIHHKSCHLKKCIYRFERHRGRYGFRVCSRSVRSIPRQGSAFPPRVGSTRRLSARIRIIVKVMILVILSFPSFVFHFWKLYFSLISHDFTQVRITPKMTANLNEVSQSTAPSPCPIRLQRNVTIAVIRKVMVNTVKNLTDSFFFVVNRKSLFIFPDFYCPCGRWYWFTLPAGYWTMYMTQKYWWTIWCALWCCFERLIGTSWVLKLWSKIIAKLPFYVLVLHACVHRVQRGLRWHDPSFSCLPCD